MVCPQMTLQSDDINNVTVKGGNWTHCQPAVNKILRVAAAPTINNVPKKRQACANPPHSHPIVQLYPMDMQPDPSDPTPSQHGIPDPMSSQVHSVRSDL